YKLASVLGFSVLGGFYRCVSIFFSTIKEQVQQNGSNRGQQDAGFDQRVNGVRHPLHVVGRNQRNHAHANGDGHNHGVVAVGLVIHAGQDADTGGGHHTEHHNPGAAQNHGGQGFNQG